MAVILFYDGLGLMFANAGPFPKSAVETRLARRRRTRKTTKNPKI